MRTVTKYIAFDNMEFDTAEACREHEAAHVEARLVGLTIEQVRAAIDRTDAELADAIEQVGARIGRDRRAAGDVKRARKGSATAVEPTTSEPVPVIEGAGPISPEERGRAAFRACQPGKIPDDLDGTPEGQEWLTGWDAESSASFKRHAAA